jgi:Na+/H+ antiporter NhaC
MRPLTDMLCVSREKLSFIVDATSAPVASIIPISSWIGFEIGLIQVELNKIVTIHKNTDFKISLNGLSVFMESVKYRYCKLKQHFDFLHEQLTSTKTSM